MTDDRNLPVLVIAGPTGSGKSALAVDVAVEFSGTVINADSMQVYRELHILTARPGREDEARAPHRLYGVLAGADRCSAGRWRDLAIVEISKARDQGRLPVVTGGTGLYLKALMEGLADIPAIAGEIRDAARALLGRLGGEAFRRELAVRDPDSALTLPANDRSRLLRAYEVVEATGRTIGDWRADGDVPRPKYNFYATVLAPGREQLYAACDRRFDAMIEAGALDEVRALLALRLDADLPVMKALGVAELSAHLLGDSDLESARNSAKKSTRNYAKRQLTWFRHQIGMADRVNTQYSESIRLEIFSNIRKFLLTAQR